MKQKIARELVSWIVTIALCTLVATIYLHINRIAELVIGYFSFTSWAIFGAFKLLNCVFKESGYNERS